jgi:hypothetical protein
MTRIDDEAQGCNLNILGFTVLGRKSASKLGFGFGRCDEELPSSLKVVQTTSGLGRLTQDRSLKLPGL